MQIQTGLPASSPELTCMVHAVKSSCDWVVTAFNQAFLSAHALTEAASMDTCKLRAKGKRSLQFCGKYFEKKCNKCFMKPQGNLLPPRPRKHVCMTSCCEGIPTEYLLAQPCSMSEAELHPRDDRHPQFGALLSPMCSNAIPSCFPRDDRLPQIRALLSPQCSSAIPSCCFLICKQCTSDVVAFHLVYIH